MISRVVMILGSSVIVACGGASSRASTLDGAISRPADTHGSSTATPTPSASMFQSATARSFAEFINQMHRRVHATFADLYLAQLATQAGSDSNNLPVQTTLEIVVSADGSLYRVTVTDSSGDAAFDVGVIDSVVAAQPFAHPPSNILSGDGRVWLRWRFDRGPAQCATFNAVPMILPDPAQAEPQ